MAVKGPRRSDGEGSIAGRRDGHWQGCIRLGGVRRFVYGRTRREVFEKLEGLRRACQTGKPDPG